MLFNTKRYHADSEQKPNENKLRLDSQRLIRLVITYQLNVAAIMI